MAWRSLSRSLGVLAAGWWLAGCATCGEGACLDDPGLPDAETAVIEGYVPLMHGALSGEIVKIEYIDEKRHSALTYGTAARVVPGVHSVQLSNCAAWGPQIYGGRACEREYRALVTLDMRAGHAYDAFADGNGQFWIVDTETGEVFIGETPALDDDAYALLPDAQPGSALNDFLPLAEDGNATAQNIVGRMYLSGEGAPRDGGEAVKWFSRAAAQGHRGAMKTLSFLYWGGEGVARDYVRAYMWYSVATTLGNEATPGGRDEIARAMTPAEIAEAEAMASAWLADYQE